MRLVPTVVAVLVGVTALSATCGHAAEDEAATLVAGAVRSRGFPCAQPLSAEPDRQASRPDEAVWMLVCNDGSYRVRFMGDTEPRIERLP